MTEKGSILLAEDSIVIAEGYGLVTDASIRFSGPHFASEIQATKTYWVSRSIQMNRESVGECTIDGATAPA